jgi:hypothetical protein
MSVTKAISENITSLDAAKLTGTLPAMSGAALTGLTQPTKSANDPTISTNPSTGVGTLWANTTSGEMFACTDATAGENVWTNVGAGTVNVPRDNVTRGAVSGYTAGGEGASPADSNVIDKFSYVSGGNATDVGDLVVAGSTGSCNSGSYGYTNCFKSGSPAGNMAKFAFASDGNAVAAGTSFRTHTNGCIGHMSPTHGYWAGGYPAPTISKYISKFSFADNTEKSSPGTLNADHGAGACGSSHFDYGAFQWGNYPNHINISKFSFSSDGNGTDHADLVASQRDCTGSNGATHAYTCMGYTTGYLTNIAKFPYASQTNATNVADMGFSTQLCSGTASTNDHGYTAGGTRSGKHNVITKYSHATDGNGVDVGDLTVARSHFGGCGATH